MNAKVISEEGVYRTVCVELEIFGFAVASIMGSGLLDAQGITTVPTTTASANTLELGASTALPHDAACARAFKSVCPPPPLLSLSLLPLLPLLSPSSLPLLPLLSPSSLPPLSLFSPSSPPPLPLFSPSSLPLLSSRSLFSSLELTSVMFVVLLLRSLLKASVTKWIHDVGVNGTLPLLSPPLCPLLIPHPPPSPSPSPASSLIVHRRSPCRCLAHGSLSLPLWQWTDSSLRPCSLPVCLSLSPLLVPLSSVLSPLLCLTSATVRVVHILMTKLFSRLISEFRNLGCKIVYADFYRIIIATTRYVGSSLPLLPPSVSVFS
jgi:hypothetical protein